MRGFPIPGYPALRLGLPAGRRLRRLWREGRPDLVHVATEGPLGASSIGAARALGVPVTSSFHTNFHAYARHYGVPVLRRAAVGWLRHLHNRTARTFAPTRELCAELAELGFLNLAVLSRGVDTRRFHPGLRSEELRRTWGAAPGDPVVFHAGRMAPEKNYGLLLEVYAAMRKAQPRCRWVIVGDGPLRPRLQREHPQAVFTGFVPRDELARHFASADIYVHASLTETFGNVLTEAMASGLAVAGFDYAAAREFVRDGENGLVAPVSRPAALVGAAVRLASDQALRARLRAAAAAAVGRQSWMDVVGRFEAELMRVAAPS